MKHFYDQKKKKKPQLSVFNRTIRLNIKKIYTHKEV